MKKILKNFCYSCIVMALFTAGCHSVGPPDPIVELQRDEAPTWSPDGQYIAYSHYNPETDEHTNPFGLYVLNLETGEHKRIIEGPAFNPDWSPDGEWITWQVHYGGKNFGIWVMRIDGSNSKEILSIEINQTIALDNISPSWSPDSQRIVFSKPNDDESKVVLWIINRDGSGLQQIAF